MQSQSQNSRPTKMVRTTAYSHYESDSLPYGRKSAAVLPERKPSRSSVT